MKTKFNELQENVDEWIKNINSQFENLLPLFFDVEENSQNIQHDYELIYELKDEIEELKKEINALKLIQIISLHKQKEEKSALKMSPLSSTG